MLATGELLRITRDLAADGFTVLRDFTDTAPVSRALADAYAAQDSAAEGMSGDERTEYEKGLIELSRFQQASRFDPFAWAREVGITDIAAALLSDPPRPYNTCARRVDPTRELNGVAWHIDGEPLNALRVSLNFWIPSVPCGPGTDAPGISFIPSSAEEMIALMGFDPALASPDEWANDNLCGSSHFFRNETWRADLEALTHRATAPTVRPGDVVVFTSWNMHATQTEGGMESQRRSLEIRFQESAPGLSPLSPTRPDSR